MRQLSFAIIAFLIASCTSNPQALGASKTNRIRVQQVTLGMTTEEVRGVMKKGPESRSMSTLADGKTQEAWNYLTDYDNHVNTTIVFTDGRVTEVKTTEWLGDGNFSPNPNR